MSTTSFHNCVTSFRFELDLLLAGVAQKVIPTVTDEDGPCSICMHSLRESSAFSCCGGYPRKLACGHIFHIGCFTIMIQTSKTFKCPCCRVDHWPQLLEYLKKRSEKK